MALISLKDQISVSNNGQGLPVDIRQQVDEYTDIFNLYQCYPGMRIYVKYDSTSRALTYPKGIYIVKSIYSGTGKPNLVEFIEDYLHISDKVNKPSDTPTAGNFVSFDKDGNAIDSDCNEGTFIKGVQKNGDDLTPDANGKVNLEVQDGITPHIDQTTKHWMIGEEDTNVDAEGKDAYQVAVSQGYEGTKSQWLASLKGEKGDNAISPFKGWYDSSSNLPANPVVGDYAYVKGVESTDPAAIYECTTTGSWSDSGRIVDTSNVQTFASGEEVNEVRIVNDLTTGGTTNVPNAEQVKVLDKKISDLILNVINKKQVNPSGSYKQGRLVQDGTIYNPSGTLSSWKYYKFFVSSDKKYTANLSVISSSTTPNYAWCGIQYYDSSDNFLGYEVPCIDSTQENIDVIMNIPSNASYCYIQTNTDHTLAKLWEFEYLSKYVDEILKSINEVNFLDYEVAGLWINAQSQITTGNTGYSSVRLPVREGDKFSIKTNNNGFYYCFLKTTTSIVTGYPRTFVQSTEEAVELTIPATATYLWISLYSQSSNYTPLYIAYSDTIEAEVKQLQSDLSSLTKQDEPIKNGVVYNYALNNTDNYANLKYYNSESITPNGYVPTAGWKNRVVIDKYIVADNISTNYEVSITNQPIIVVGSIDSNFTSSKHATLVKIDFSTQKVSFLTGSSDAGGSNIDGTTIPEYSYADFDITNISGTEYRIEVGRKNRCPYVKIYNLKTSQICCDEILSIYETSSSYGSKAGAMYDFPVFGSISGTCCFKRVFCAVSPNYDVVFIGDSITEGSQLAIEDVWANKVINSDYVKSGLNCGRGGGNIDHVLRCLTDIVSTISVKMVVVTIGTNGGNTQAKLERIKELTDNIGANLVLNCIPMISSGYPSANDTILGIDAIHCRFDVATAVNNDVNSGQNTSLFFSDRTHPNINGGLALYNNFMANVGSVISI